PAYTQSSLIPVDYTADGTGSALRTVELWVRAPGASKYSLADIDKSPASSAHHFDYHAAPGDGQYAFYTRAFDSAGNAETTPTAADTTTSVDQQAPTSTATAIAQSRSMSVSVGYVANGTGSPLSRVELWVRGPFDVVYSKALTDTSPAQTGRSFNYLTSS